MSERSCNHAFFAVANKPLKKNLPTLNETRNHNHGCNTASELNTVQKRSEVA